MKVKFKDFPEEVEYAVMNSTLFINNNLPKEIKQKLLGQVDNYEGSDLFPLQLR